MDRRKTAGAKRQEFASPQRKTLKNGGLQADCLSSRRHRRASDLCRQAWPKLSVSRM